MGRLWIVAIFWTLGFGITHAQTPSTAPAPLQAWELRVLYPAEGRLPELQDRFRNHTTRLLARHGISVQAAYIVRDEQAGDRLIALLAAPDTATRDRAWTALVLDPEWQRIKQASDAKGRLVERVQEYQLTAEPNFPIPGSSPAASTQSEIELVTHTVAMGQEHEEAGHQRLRQQHPNSTLMGRWKLVNRPANAVTLIHLISPAPAPEIILASATTGPESARGIPPVPSPTLPPGFGRLRMTPLPLTTR